jgi:hypothetical protein
MVKKNHPSLYAQVKARPWRDIPALDRERGRGHGRIEHRTVKIATVDDLLFPHAVQAFRIQRQARDLDGGAPSPSSA